MVRLPWRRRPVLEERVSTFRATDGRDVLRNRPDGWEVDRPWLWWVDGEDGAANVWGNPPPGADEFWWLSSLPAVTRCTSIICDTIAGLPWQVFRGDDILLDTPDWIADPQATRPDGRVVGSVVDDTGLPPMAFWANWICSALWWGDGYIYAPVRDSTGAPRPPLWQLHADDVTVADGRYWVGDVDLEPGSVIHLRGFLPYWGGRGRGVLRHHALDLGLAVTVRKYTASTYRSGVPSGYLKSSQPHMDEAQAEVLKQKWMAAHGAGRRSIAVLNATTDFNPISISPVDAALDQARTWSLRDVALAFGVASYMVGVAGDQSTYANVESRMIEFETYTLLRWIRQIESTLDACFPRGTSLKIKTAGLLRSDTATRYNQYKTAIEAGFLTVDEVRALEDLPPLGQAPTPAPAAGGVADGGGNGGG